MNYWNEIKEEINAYLPDNNNKEITASRLRTVMNDVVDNINNWYYGTEEINDQYYTNSYIDTHFYTKNDVDDIEATLVEDIGDANGRITDIEDNLSSDYYTKNDVDDICGGLESRIDEINMNYVTKSYVSSNYYDKQYISDFQTNVDNTTDDLDNRLSGVEDHINESNNIVVGTERKIGTWTEDGVTYDLYEKVVNVGALPNADTLEVLHGVTNKVRFVETSGFAYGQNNINIPFVNASGSMCIYMGVGNTKITITTSSDRSNMTGYVTLRYIRARQ